ncbi:hypothetical protein AaE_010530, partial [Aphanomyces astaci]
MELVHVLAVFRHGDRSPITGAVGTMLKMSEGDTAYWISQLASEASRRRLNALVAVHGSDSDAPPPMPGGVWPKGHLTEQGVADMERRGRAFRRRYQVFLANMNIHDVVYATSTNIRRTILSAQSFLAGLCHDIDGLTSDNPFVLHTVDPKELTPILTGHDYRQGAQHAREVALSTLSGYKALEDAVKDVLGIRGVVNWASCNVPLYLLREVLDCLQAHQLPLPNGMTSVMYESIVHHAAWEWYMFYSDAQRGQRGFLLAMRTFQSLLSDAVEMAPQRRRLTLVSAHDNSLVALVCALQLHHSSGIIAPSYGSML